LYRYRSAAAIPRKAQIPEFNEKGVPDRAPEELVPKNPSAPLTKMHSGSSASSGELPIIDELQDVAAMPDEDLMKLCQEGDEGAFEVLFQRYEAPALSFIHRMIGDQSRTEALGQEAFLRIFKDARGYQYPRSFTTWFYTIVRNLCKNELRWKSRHPTISLEENVNAEHSSDNKARIGDFLRAESNDPLDTMVSQEMNQKLQQSLNALPELEREILILSRFQGLKYRDISEIVGVPVSSVRQKIYSTLEQLRKSIKDYL
jgi:RNA polymerase sigma-70 factor, ECF subfamily